MAFRYSGTGWKVAEGIRVFGDQIMEIRGFTTSFPDDGTLGNLEHSNRVSDHNPDNGIVRAIDFHEHELGFVDEVFETMRRERDPRLKYCIHDDRMFSSYVPPSGAPAWTWRPYTGVNGHETHGHLSTLESGDNDASPWNLGQEEDDMPLTDEDTQKIWFHRITDPVTGEQRGAAFHLAQARSDSLRARVAAETSLAILKQGGTGADGAPITEAEIDAIAAGVLEEIRKEWND